MKRILGILVHQILDPHRYDPVRMIAIESGFDDILLYTPMDIQFKAQMIFGYTFKNRQWQQILQPFPNISYDIGYYQDMQSIQIMRKIKQNSKLPLIGYSIGSKWTIHQHLASSKRLRPFLLPTQRVHTTKMIFDMIEKHQSIMLKPLNGSGGRGIVRLTKDSQIYHLTEHDQSQAVIYTKTQLQSKISSLLRTKKYIAQKWIDIRNEQNYVFDIRALMQKNHHGKWQLTVMGVRQGEAEKITSNLSGGGQVFPIRPFLEQQYNHNVARELHHKLHQLSTFIPPFLEKTYKRRLVELGLDLAIDRQQRIWIIEVNIKPGKTLLRKLQQAKSDDEALRAPIRYGRYLLDGSIL